MPRTSRSYCSPHVADHISLLEGAGRSYPSIGKREKSFFSRRSGRSYSSLDGRADRSSFSWRRADPLPKVRGESKGTVLLGAGGGRRAYPVRKWAESNAFFRRYRNMDTWTPCRLVVLSLPRHAGQILFFSREDFSVRGASRLCPLSLESFLLALKDEQNR